MEPNQKVVCDAESRLEFYARLAWLPEYSSVYEFEAKINGATGKVDEFASSYRQRQLVAGSDGTREKSEHRISQDLERVLREQDMHYIPFSQAIKSAIYMVDQVSTKIWEKERKDRRIAGRDYGTKLLWKMIDVRPEPEEERNEDISFWVFDQTNVMAGGGHGHGSKKFGGIGRLDKDGNVIKVQRETYINSFDVFVSAGECQLSDQARDLIRRKGPYTQDFARVLPVMTPERADTFMSLLLIKMCTALSRVTDVRLLPLILPLSTSPPT